MLGHLVDHAKLRLSIAATHYGGRMLVFASCAVAAIFALAATFILIADRAGAVAACLTMAGAFLLLALVLSFIMGTREQSHRIAMSEAQKSTAIATGLASLLPAAMASGRRIVRRANLGTPLVLGSVLLAALYALRGRSEAAVRETR